MIISKVRYSSDVKITFPILVIDEYGNIFFVNKDTNGKYSPCINTNSSGIFVISYTSYKFDINLPFPQNNYDLFTGTIILTQEF